jgi:hypothetical protein
MISTETLIASFLYRAIGETVVDAEFRFLHIVFEITVAIIETCLGAYKVEKSFWGEKTNGGEPTSNLAVTYSYKNWQFGVLGLFVFYPHGCVYKDELFNKYVQQKNKVRLADQGNMLVFTASFNFSHGRRYHTGSRKLNNSDRDNGIR